jgi:hypothetical protein
LFYTPTLYYNSIHKKVLSDDTRIYDNECI